MPKPLWTYLIALLHFTKVSTCSAIAEIVPKASHDCLTRMLNGDWSGQTLLDWALRLLFRVVGGYLIVDDTVVEKPHAVLDEDRLSARRLFPPGLKGVTW